MTLQPLDSGEVYVAPAMIDRYGEDFFRQFAMPKFYPHRIKTGLTKVGRVIDQPFHETKHDQVSP